VVERAVYRSDAPLIDEIVFNPFSPLPRPALEDRGKGSGEEQGSLSTEDLLDKPFEQAVSELKIRLLRRALRKARHNQKQAARILGLTYHQFRGVYRKYSEKL
jgi:psp operon transcriptional activator